MTNSVGSALTNNNVDLLENDYEIIDIPLLLEDISPENSTKLQSIYSDWCNCCIYRVPRKLRGVNEAAYTPQVVSIGPFHHGKPNLRAMECLKARYCNQFCRRTGKSFKDIISIIDEHVEKSIRACYAGTFKSIRAGFVEMVVTDACFILELLLRSFDREDEDYILNKPWLRNCVEHDLILLENQLPFFVLEKIFDFASPAISSNPFKDNKSQLMNKEDCSTFLKLSCEYFSKHHHLRHETENLISDVRHFTDLLRSYFCSSKLANGGNKIESLRNATKLDEAGVDFEAVDTTYLEAITFLNGRCLRHCPCFNCSWILNWLACFFHVLPCLKCEQPTLKLPRFQVDDTTESVFRNLMALEQCHYPSEAYICNYISLMDKLINTTEDVELLIDKKVITNFLGSSKAVAELLNKLCQHILEQNSCFYACVQEINGHCNNPLNRIMATLTSVYFRDFWRGTATVVGLIVLGITFWRLFLRHIIK